MAKQFGPFQWKHQPGYRKRFWFLKPNAMGSHEGQIGVRFWGWRWLIVFFGRRR